MFFYWHVVYLAHQLILIRISLLPHIFFHHHEDQILQLDTCVVNQKVILAQVLQNKSLIQWEVLKPLLHVDDFTAQQRVEPLLVDHNVGVFVVDLHACHPHQSRHLQNLFTILTVSVVSHVFTRGLIV